ncbi:MAG: oxygenase MpaB family protein [Verrucomicrobiota bacterium JB025]|nr:oxygenase MpaB family protein [Verrucomicrobiota bacterium JB025]
MIAAIQKRIGRRFRALLTSNPSGEVPWLEAVAGGEGPGFFRPDEAPWVVHADMATLVGGVRALLMQALHPGSLAGVLEHSRYKDDPLGRLAGTIQWLTVTTFASRESILREAGRVRSMHGKVRGTYRDAQGHEREYRASDPELLLWVHIAFMESFLRCHQTYGSVPIPGGADAYVGLWRQSVEPLGLEDAPANEREMQEAIDRFGPQLVVSDATREVIEWLRRPPLPMVSRIAYRGVFQAAYLTLPENQRQMIGMRAWPRWLVVPPTRFFLRALRWLIGPEDPLQDAAIERLRRAGVVA